AHAALLTMSAVAGPLEKLQPYQAISQNGAAAAWKTLSSPLTNHSARGGMPSPHVIRWMAVLARVSRSQRPAAVSRRDGRGRRIRARSARCGPVFSTSRAGAGSAGVPGSAGVVGEGAVGLGHAVRLVARRHGFPLAAGGAVELLGELAVHGAAFLGTGGV